MRFCLTWTSYYSSKEERKNILTHETYFEAKSVACQSELNFSSTNSKSVCPPLQSWPICCEFEFMFYIPLTRLMPFLPTVAPPLPATGRKLTGLQHYADWWEQESFCVSGVYQLSTSTAASGVDNLLELVYISSVGDDVSIQAPPASWSKQQTRRTWHMHVIVCGTHVSTATTREQPHVRIIWPTRSAAQTTATTGHARNAGPTVNRAEHPDDVRYDHQMF